MKSISRRQFVASGLIAGVMASASARSLWAANANDSINVGFIGCGGRAGGLAKQFSKIEGVNIAGLCDPDRSRVEIMKFDHPQAETWSDLRDLLASDNIDVAVIATCNHWHCLAAILAMEAGKDVYVEKPLSHSQWEGLQTVAAARRFNRVCQLGTQQRSDPMQGEIKKFLHQENALGEITVARVNRFGIRNSIGKRDKPLEIDKSIDYDLWLGPAQDKPIFRDRLQYDWHWDWNTGSGEMGNWGVHVLDDVRNVVFQDKVALPRKIFGGGGRVVWNDAGESPNVHFVYFDTGSIPVVIGLSNLAGDPQAANLGSLPHPGPGSGYIVYGEGGRLEGQRAAAVAFDNNNKIIRKFKGNSGDLVHQQNFIDAVRSRDASRLNADVEVGNHSTGWCNLANIAFQTGSRMSFEDARTIKLAQWRGLLKEMDAHVQTHGLKLDGGEFRLSAILEVDLESEQFFGDQAVAANQFLKREYRRGYEVPELAKTTTG